MVRPFFRAEIDQALRRSPVAVITGPRQCGKTTLARSFVRESSANYFDLENPVSLVRLAEPMSTLESLEGLIVIDEVQRMPALFPIIRVLADRKPLKRRFLLLGSVSPTLMRNVSETLAGRTESIELTPFRADEIPQNRWNHLWLRGGFPLSYLAKNDEDSFRWRQNYTETFLQLDLPLLGFNVSVDALRRFWFMLAHYHGNLWNAAEPARSLGVNETTVRRYLDILAGLYLVRVLKPWHENLSKRQIKAPKIFFRDSGLLHYMLGIRSRDDLLLHPRLGASWEGFVLEQILRCNAGSEAYFWATHAGAELDLLIMQRGKRIGYEIKRKDAPQLTPSMRIAKADLKLDKLLVVYPGNLKYTLAPDIEVVPANAVLHQVKSLPQKTKRKIKPTSMR